MQPVETIRGFQLDQLAKALPSITYVIQSALEADLRRYRDGGTGWTALEVLCHIRDYDVIFADRVRLALAEDMPKLPDYNADVLAQERDYNGQPVAEVLASWAGYRQDLLTLFSGIAADDWQRGAIHFKRGPVSVQDLLALNVWHDLNHLEQMTRVLAEKQE